MCRYGVTYLCFDSRPETLYLNAHPNFCEFLRKHIGHTLVQEVTQKLNVVMQNLETPLLSPPAN